MTEFCKSEKMTAPKAHREAEVDTVCGAPVGDRHLALVSEHLLDLTEYSNPIPTTSQRRLIAMMRSLQEVEARNAELERALREKDYATMDKHIADHQQHGHLVNAMARHSVIELHKQLLSASQVLEWTVA
jgi:uncharacterized membrane-anchored protein